MSLPPEITTILSNAPPEYHRFYLMLRSLEHEIIAVNSSIVHDKSSAIDALVKMYTPLILTDTCKSSPIPEPQNSDPAPSTEVEPMMNPYDAFDIKFGAWSVSSSSSDDDQTL